METGRKERVTETKQKLIKYGAILLGVIILAAAIIIGYRVYTSSEQETTKIGFENIGELATQSAYCTEVNVTDKSKKLWKVKIPFTQSKYIYSYDFVVKAGFNFGEITWEETNQRITVKLPKAKVLSVEPVDGSFKVFHEKESIFQQVKLEENMEALEEMKNQAKEDAIANGLYDNAKANAESMLTAFFGSTYDMSQYKIEFVYE